MQISVTLKSKKKVPYKTLFLTLIYIDNRYGLEISCWGSNQSCKYIDNVKEFREKNDNTRMTLILNLNTLIYPLVNESPS